MEVLLYMMLIIYSICVHTMSRHLTNLINNFYDKTVLSLELNIGPAILQLSAPLDKI